MTRPFWQRAANLFGVAPRPTVNIRNGETGQPADLAPLVDDADLAFIESFLRRHPELGEVSLDDLAGLATPAERAWFEDIARRLERAKR